MTLQLTRVTMQSKLNAERNKLEQTRVEADLRRTAEMQSSALSDIARLRNETLGTNYRANNRHLVTLNNEVCSLRKRIQGSSYMMMQVSRLEAEVRQDRTHRTDRLERSVFMTPSKFRPTPRTPVSPVVS